MNTSCNPPPLKAGPFVDFSAAGQVNTWTKVHTGAWQSTHYGPALFAYFGAVANVNDDVSSNSLLLRFNRSYVWVCHALWYPSYCMLPG